MMEVKFFAGLLLFITFALSASISFKAQAVKTKAIPSVDRDAFAIWFAKPTTPATILSLNPGLEKVEAISDATNSEQTVSRVYTGYLSPIKFPGLSVQSIVQFDTVFDGKSFHLTCKDGIKQEYTGNRLFAKAVSRLVPKLKSTNVFEFMQESSLLKNEATLEIQFDLPSWFPVNKQAVENGGSAAIQKSMDADLSGLLDRILNTYEGNKFN